MSNVHIFPATGGEGIVLTGTYPDNPDVINLAYAFDAYPSGVELPATSAVARNTFGATANSSNLNSSYARFSWTSEAEHEEVTKGARISVGAALYRPSDLDTLDLIVRIRVNNTDRFKYVLADVYGGSVVSSGDFLGSLSSNTWYDTIVLSSADVSGLSTNIYAASSATGPMMTRKPARLSSILMDLC